MTALKVSENQNIVFEGSTVHVNKEKCLFERFLTNVWF